MTSKIGANRTCIGKIGAVKLGATQISAVKPGLAQGCSSEHRPIEGLVLPNLKVTCWRDRAHSYSY